MSWSAQRKYLGLLARVGGEFADQVFVGAPINVGVPDARGARVSEFVEQVAEALVALRRATEVDFAVEVDITEDAVELFFVGVLYGFQCDVDQLADVVLVAVG